MMPILALLLAQWLGPEAPMPSVIPLQLPPYVCTSAGCVSRPVPAKLGDLISVKDFGAVGDWNGTTGADDTVAVNSAIMAAGGDLTKVFFPCPGLYHTTVLGDQVCSAQDLPTGAQVATQQVVLKLVKGVEDVFITVVSDSTAVTGSYLTTPNPVRWVSRLGTGLGNKFPAYTVKLNQWDDVGNAYQGWATLHTGTGSQTLWIYNASYTGVSSQYALGSRLSPMVLATTPDLIMVSHGHNEGSTSYSWLPDMVGLTEELGKAVQNASILIIGQNPEASPVAVPLNQTLRVSRYAEHAGRRGYGFLNIYQAFIDYSATWATDLMNADGVHANDTGQQLWADETIRAFSYRKYGTMPSTQQSTLSTAVPDQILVNGNFSEWDGTGPAHWVQNLGTLSQDTTNFESTNGYALKITTAAATAYVSQALPLALIKGQCVTFAARSYVATGQPLNSGWFFVNDNTGNSHATVSIWGLGAFRWKIIQRCFASNITSAEVRLYGDASTTSGVATWDRVSAVIGLLPYDAQMNRDAIRAYRVKADFTTAANTNLQAITGLTWTIPPLVTGALATAFPFECHILYSQGTANAAVAFGVQSGLGMASLNAQGRIQTAAAAFTAGALTLLTTTTATAVVTATPGAIATVFVADVHGVQEQSVLNVMNSMQIMVSTATAADAVTVLRGSYCLVKFN